MTDIKFDIDGKQLSSEEINAKKDFDSFYKGVQAKGKMFYQKSWFWASTGIASLLIAALLLVPSEDNSKRVNALNTTPNSELKETPFVNPPFEELRVKGDVFKVNANKGGIFTSRHGSILKIPALAFLTRKGKTIKNQTVDVKFTEFKDVADQIISGIPMTYDSAGTKYMFSSAGMIEIRGFIGDSAVNLNAEKPIEVEMKSAYKSNEYNFYCLNEKDKKWDYRGKDSVGQPNEGKLSDEQIKAQFPEIEKSDIVIPDNLVEAEIQQAPEYQKRKRKRIQIKQDIENLSAATPVKPIKADENAQKFSLDIIEEENPELAPYKDVQFQLAPGEKINSQHTSQNWNKVNVEKAEGNQVIITFSKTNSHQKVQYKAIPVLDGDAFEKAHKDYLAHQDKIGGKRKELKEAQRQLKFFKQEVKNSKLSKALVKAKLDRLEQIATLEKSKLENRKTKEKITRYFEVSSFGIFNCDKAKSLLVSSKPIIKNIQFGQQINETVVIDVFPKLNGIFEHTAIKNQQFNQYSNSKKTIGISKKKIGILRKLENGKIEFIVKGKPKSKGELVSWLEL